MRENPDEMRRLRHLLETAEFDHGQDDDPEHDDTGDVGAGQLGAGQAGVGQAVRLGGDRANDETSDKGRADVRTRYTNPRSGDNALRDLLDEDTPGGVIDRLEAMLRKAGVSDAEMRAGINLTPSGQQKAAARLGLAADDVALLLDSLTTRMRDADAHSEPAYESAYAAAMDESAERYGYEKDGVGSVTVRDAQTGKEAYLQGSQATDLLTRLQQQPDATQAILGTLAPLMEHGDPLAEAVDDPSRAEIALRRTIMRRGKRMPGPAQPNHAAPDRAAPDHAAIVDEADGKGYLAEMRRDHGSFNFTWKEAGTQGTGTAGYSFAAGKLKINLLGVRDAGGTPVQPDPGLRRTLERVARDYVRDEAV
jgi:hypothetical protein